jgi:hypothetical protein
LSQVTIPPPAPAGVSIGEINPGALNPTMTPGHNNAVYVFVMDGSKQNFKVAIWSEYDTAQKKYKYYKAYCLNGNLAGIPANALIYDYESDQEYWQCEDQNDKDLCTVGESVSKASTTSAIVFVQKLNASLPAQ